MRIRPYQSSDWPTLCVVHDAARREELRRAGDEAAFVPLKDAVVDDLLAHDIWVADDGSSLRGFTAVRGSHIGWLYVDPSHAGRGIGRALLQHAVSLCFFPPITIGTLAGNAPALKLYASEGFVVTRLTKILLSGDARYPATACYLEKQS